MLQLSVELQTMGEKNCKHLLPLAWGQIRIPVFLRWILPSLAKLHFQEVLVNADVIYGPTK